MRDSDIFAGPDRCPDRFELDRDTASAPAVDPEHLGGPDALDLVITGAQVFDPQRPGLRLGDVGVRSGRIAVVTPGIGSLSASRVIQAAGRLLTPGLVDLHTHVFAGQDLGVPSAELGFTGVTTAIDAGSAGADLYGAFRQVAVMPGPVRVRALLNIASIGTTSIMRAGELGEPRYLDEDAAVDCVLAHQPEIVGIKIRASRNVGPGHVPHAFDTALRVAETVAMPLMVHVGPAPMRLDDVCRALRPGDIITHCFSGLARPALATVDGVLPAAAEARERGVLFDVGHGNAGFDAEIAAQAIAAGFAPDTISTDVHAYSRRSAKSLPAVLAKLVALGLDLDAALRAVTLTPAQAVGLDRQGVGTLQVGADADLALFTVLPGQVSFTDTVGHAFVGSLTLHPYAVWRQGAELAAVAADSPLSRELQVQETLPDALLQC